MKDAKTGAPRVVSFAEAAELLSGYDVVFFGESHRHPSPPTFVDGEDTSAWVRALMAKRKASACEYSPPEAAKP